MTEAELLRGVIAADDERLRVAAERVWGEHVWGCDTAEHLADLILELRAQLAMTKGEVMALVAEVRLACEQSALGRAHSAAKLRRVALRAAEALEGLAASGASGQAVSDR